jgi:hypothetical protein
MLSDKQIKRQQRRKSSGQYDEYNRCEVCGKTVGDDYCSHVKCNEWGFLISLCHACEEATRHIKTLEEAEASSKY